MEDSFFEDASVFYGDKDFYDIDGNGFLDDMEGVFMLSDVADEIAEFEQSRPVSRAKNSDVHLKDTLCCIVLIWGIVIPIYAVIHVLCNW